MLRAGFASAIAYRAEFVVWFLSTNMPLVMWLLFSTVAEEAPVGRYGPKEFGAYFLVTLIVRMLTGVWVAWMLNDEVRQGLLAQRLLRPIHPFFAYAAENLGALPLRMLMLAPIAIAASFYIGREGITHSPAQLTMGIVSIALAWLLQFAAQTLIGTLALFWSNALALLDLWFGLYVAFSGYLMPIDLFPGWLQNIVRASPFPYLISQPVSAILGSVTPEQTLHGLLIQLVYVAAFTLASFGLFHVGMKRFQAFGG